MEFDQFACDYEHTLDRNIAISGETSTYFARYKALYLRRLLSPLFSGKVLEFGCGIGMLSGFLKEYLPAIQLDGFDVSKESLRRVAAGLRRQGIFTSDPDDLGSDYSLIVVANVMHHIAPEERRTVVQELADRLASGGRVAIFEHNPANPLTRWAVEHCPFDEDVVLLAPRETNQYLSQANLRVLRRDYIVFMPHFLAPLRLLEPWLAWLPIGGQYVIIAQRRDSEKTIGQHLNESKRSNGHHDRQAKEVIGAIP